MHIPLTLRKRGGRRLVVVTPDGQVESRYEKVHRVPFGEYMPLRGLLHALGAPTDLRIGKHVPASSPGSHPYGRLNSAEFKRSAAFSDREIA